MAANREWVLLAYRMPREPSTPRISVWRKLRRLGAVQLLDGLVALPHDARTKEHLEWIADEVVAAGGDANVWLAHPGSKAQEREMTAQMSAAAEDEYETLIADARAAARESPGTRKRTLAKLRRDLKQIRQRDHFPKRGYERAMVALDRLAASVHDEVTTRA